MNGLSSENSRWGQAILQFGVQEEKLVGDVLLASSFVSYVGPFNSKFRDELVNTKWMPDIKEREIPMTEGLVLLDLLSGDASRARWANQVTRFCAGACSVTRSDELREAQQVS